MSTDRKEKKDVEPEYESVITINAGGKKYSTTISTLRSDDSSRLYDMFAAKNVKLFIRDGDGNCFLDLNGRHFGYILDYLRIIKNLRMRKGALRPLKGSNEIRGKFKMYGREYEVRDIWLGDSLDACSADELLEHILPSTTDDLYGVLMQAEYFGLHHCKAIIAKRLQKGDTTSFLLEDMLEALGGKKKNGEGED